VIKVDKRIVLTIYGPGKLAYNKSNVIELNKQLSNNSLLKVYVVRDGEKSLGIEEIENVLKKIESQNKLTIIVFCHGILNIKNDFMFDFGQIKMSANDLFSLIARYRNNNPVDIFSPACHGAGMIEQKDFLPSGSTIATLTSKDRLAMVNVLGITKVLHKMDKEFTAYNLLEFYLLTSIDNRCYPFVATSGNDAIINLNQFLKSDNYGQIQLDEEQYNYVKKIGNPVYYLFKNNKTVKYLSK
jgi:RNA-binding protein YhbY